MQVPSDWQVRSSTTITILIVCNGRCAYGDRCAYNHDIISNTPTTIQLPTTTTQSSSSSQQQQHVHVSERYLDQVVVVACCC